MLDLPSARDWVKLAPQSPKVERLEAFFGAHGFDPHRHDTYAIGRTLAGVQNFHYRGSTRHSLPGQTMVLHPDEAHDGHAGCASGFHYRMHYITPALVGGTDGQMISNIIAFHMQRSNNWELAAALGSLLLGLILLLYWVYDRFVGASNIKLG